MGWDTTTMFFSAEEVKETSLDFSKGTVKVTCAPQIYLVLIWNDIISQCKGEGVKFAA